MAVAHAAARGLVAAMAMSGTRRVTTNLGLLPEEPPTAVADAVLPLSRLSRAQREVAVELAHWAYGAAAGAAFGSLPRGLRKRPLAGPLYGLAIWLAFELGIAPLIGTQYPEERGVAGRFALAADHILYGLVVGGHLAPEREAIPNRPLVPDS